MLRCRRFAWPIVAEWVLICLLSLAARSEAAGPVNIGWVPFGGATTAGYIAPDGTLTLFDGGGSGWTLRSGVYPVSLIPGAPLALLPQAAGDLWPTVVTVSGTNKLTRIVDGGVPQTLLASQSFPVGASIKDIRNGPASIVAAVTGTGELWCVDPVSGVSHQISGPGEVFPFGAPVCGVAAASQYHLFAVDQYGTLQYYFGSGGSWTVVPIAGGLIPGTPVATDVFPLGPSPVQMLHVALVDPAGNLVLWSKPAGLPWQTPAVCASGLSPAAQLEIGYSAYGPMLSTISAGGDWNIWIHGHPGGWGHHLVGPGFLPGAPVACAPAVGTFFTVDPLGRMVCANWSGSSWSTGYAIPQLAYSPQLVSRQLLPNPPLPPAEVTLTNSGTDPLVVQIVDLFRPTQPPEEKIPANGSVQVSLERESGGTLEEVFLVPGPGGILLEQTASHPIPPRQRYTLTVWSDRETYKVLPFKGAKKGAPKSVTEGFSRRTQVSLGVISVPPGDLLNDGEQMDLILITRRLNNPGAVAHFPRPVDQP